MTSPAHNFPGATASRGTIRIGQVLSSGRGANSGLHVHPQGHRLVSGWCGAQSSVDLWAVDRAQHLGGLELDVELTDVGAQVDDSLMPPGTDRNRDAWPAHVLPVVDLKIDRHGGHVAMAAGRGLHLYRIGADEASLEPMVVLRGHEQPVARVALDGGAERALSSDARGHIMLWSTHDARALHQLRISKVPTHVEFIWNDMLAMASDNTGRIVCWELEHGRRHLQFQAHQGAVVSTSFNTDSGVLLTAGHDNAARLWNLELGKQIGNDMRHRGPIHDVTFAYAGRFVVTCGADGNVAVWNSTDGDLLDWYFDSGPVYRVAFDRLNGTLVIAGARTIKILNVNWQRLRELDADARAQVMDISPAEHAAMFSQPPSRAPVTYTGGPQADAPVGSVLAARQTADLPFPDRSNLVLQRSEPAGAAFGGPTPQTQALPSIGETRAPGFGAPSGGFGGHVPGATPATGPLGFGAAAQSGPATGPVGPPSLGGTTAPQPGHGTMQGGGATGPQGGFRATQAFGVPPERGFGTPGFAEPGPAPDRPTGFGAPPAAPSASPAAFGGAPATTALGALPAPNESAAPGFGNLADAMDSQTRASSTGRRTAYGLTGKVAAASAPDDDIDSFFTAPAGSRHTRMETDAFDEGAEGEEAPTPVEPPPSPEPPPPPQRFTGRQEPSERSTPEPSPEGEALKEVFADAQTQRAARVGLVRKRMGIGVAVLLVVAVLSWVGTRTYYTVEGFPGEVRYDAQVAEENHEAAILAVEADLATFVAEEQAQIRDYERSGALPVAELERVRMRIERRIDEKREEAQLARRRADDERDARLAELDDVRSAKASDLANKAAGIAGLLTLLLAGLWVGRAARP